MPAIYDWRTRAIKAEEENKKLRSELGGMRKAVPGNPMDWPLPCDVTIGAGTIKAGCSLNALVARAQALHDLNNILLQARRDAAAGAQPATPSTQITPNWIWSWLMDWCKRRGVPPSNYDSLFQMASDALLLAAGGPSAPSGLETRMYQDAEGKRPVTGVNQPVGLVRQSWAPKRKPLTDAMVEAAGRALSDRHANGCGCGMDKDIMWGSYSDEFKEQARVALGAAHGIKENSND